MMVGWAFDIWLDSSWLGIGMSRTYLFLTCIAPIRFFWGLLANHQFISFETLYLSILLFNTLYLIFYIPKVNWLL